LKRNEVDLMKKYLSKFENRMMVYSAFGGAIAPYTGSSVGSLPLSMGWLIPLGLLISLVSLVGIFLVCCYIDYLVTKK
jgi:hypothetical protein